MLILSTENVRPTAKKKLWSMTHSFLYVHKIIVVFNSIIKPKSKSLHRSFGELFQEHLENPELIEKTQENKPGEN